METFDLIILGVSVAYSFLLIELIDNYGITQKMQLLFLLPPVIAAVVFILLPVSSPFLYLDYGFLITPVIVVFMYNLLNLFSWKIHNREFRLWIRGSRNYKHYELLEKKENYSWTDSLFSFLLIFTLMGFAPLFAALLHRILD